LVMLKRLTRENLEKRLSFLLILQSSRLIPSSAVGGTSNQPGWLTA